MNCANLASNIVRYSVQKSMSENSYRILQTEEYKSQDHLSQSHYELNDIRI